MKKFFSIFLSLEMLFAVIPGVNVFAVGDKPDSALVDHWIPTDNRNDDGRVATIYITPHCMAGEMSAVGCAKMFQKPEAWVSANYMIGASGDVAQGVPEKDRAWTSGGPIRDEGLITGSENDRRAITIECASDTSGEYVNKAVFDKMLDLITDILKRHGKDTLIWIPNKREALTYEPKSNEMVVTVHRWYANKLCPGEYIFNRLSAVAEEVTARLHGNSPISLVPSVAAPSEFNVVIEETELRIRKGAGTDTDIISVIGKAGTYDIVEKKFGPGSDKGWGRLKDGRGWISLDYATFVEATVTENAATFKVRIEETELKIREYAGTDKKILGRIGKAGVYEIVATKLGVGSNVGWGRLKDGGWISLDYATVVRDSVPVG